MEAPTGYMIATKNRKHFEPLTQILNKSLSESEKDNSRATWMRWVGPNIRKPKARYPIRGIG